MSSLVAASPHATAPLMPARRWLAFVLGALVTGWGLFYAGRPRAAVALVAGFWACLLVGGRLGVFGTPVGMLAIAVLWLLVKCISAVAGAWLARRRAWRPSPRNQLFYLAAMGCSLWLLLHVAAWPYLLGFTGMRIEGNGMAPTLVDRDTVVCANRSQYELGDVVAYLNNGRQQVKRIAGLGGDTVQIVGGNLRLNGHELGPFYAGPHTAPYSDSFEPTVVGNDQLFMLGDNRDRSRDSRFDGPVARDQLLCQVTGIFFSPLPGRTGLRLD